MTISADLTLDAETLTGLDELLDPEQVRDLVIDHLVGSQQRRAQLMALAEAREVIQLGRVAHDIISTSANFGMNACRDCAKRIEVACKAGFTELALEEATHLAMILPQQLGLLAHRYHLPWPPP